MAVNINRLYSISCYGIGALLCASLMACSSDSIINDVEEPQGQVPMQFSQAAVNAPSIARATTRGTILPKGFLVSCYKNSNTTSPRQVMDKYEVKYYAGGWDNSQTRWDYVGTKSNGFYKDQVQRYWDTSALPYRFTAISPCPKEGENIDAFTLTNKQLSMPETAVYTHQTCTNGTSSDGAEPYYVADTTYVKQAEKVALPFHHITSKVRFAIYCSQGVSLKLNQITIKATREDGFITSANSYHADLTGNKSALSGQFKNITKAESACTLLTDEDFVVSTDKSKPYYFNCSAGLLQIPQQDVKLTLTLEVDGEQKEIPITINENEKTIDSFTWEPNKIYTYILNVSNIKPLIIVCSAELAPWQDVEGAIETNLEK